jgi:glycosyltransferase involved in cell wall biosynthesis
MAAGVPTVVAVREDNFPGIALENGTNVVLTPTDDPSALAATLGDVLDDAAWREQLGKAEQALVYEKFSMKTVLEQHVRALSGMVTGTSR